MSTQMSLGCSLPASASRGKLGVAVMNPIRKILPLHRPEGTPSETGALTENRDRFQRQGSPASVERIDAFQDLKRRNTVSVYGSARTRPGDGYYEHAKRVSEALAKAGFNVVTGGGPGSMRAVAEGALPYPVKSLGLAMSFIGEEPSADVHKDMRHFNCFFDRMNTFEAEAALTASVPGGIGTLMELTNIATKLDTQNTPFPMQRQIVLFDKDGVFKDFIKHLDENFIQRGLMGKKILDIFKVVDEHHIEDGVALLKANQSFTAAA